MLRFSTDAIDTWIAVTGVIRSGTTFAGTVLSLPLEVDYLHEPFNGGYSLPDSRPFRPRYVRPEADDADARAYRAQLAKLLSYDFALPTTHNPKDSLFWKAAKTAVGSRGPFYLRLAKLNPFHRAAVLKDPTCKLAAEYLYRTFGITPVILIRHPASLAASLKRVGWWPGVREFAEQPDLVEDYFPDERDFLTREWESPLLKSAAHWRAAYKVLLTQAAKYPDWHVITHEALSARPLPIFEHLYDAFGLPWSAAVEHKIRALTQGHGSAEALRGKVMDLQRNSSEIFALRRNSLSVEERRAIFEIVKDVALQVYSEDSFALD